MDNKNSKPIEAKVNATFRCSAAVKQQLINQAQAAGLPPSQYYEMVLINGSKDQDEIVKLKSELESSQNNLSNSEAKHNLETNSLVKELETGRIEIQNSQSQLKAAFDEIARLKNIGHQKTMGKVRDEEKSLEESIGQELPGYATPHDIMVPFF